jgi:hypothetical protein
MNTTELAAISVEQFDLYKNIQAFSLDAIDATYPLSHRLARENRWTLRYAQRTIEEYRTHLTSFK